jgi:hypothetical protein
LIGLHQKTDKSELNPRSHDKQAFNLLSHLKSQFSPHHSTVPLQLKGN